MHILKKVIFFFELSPFADLDFVNLLSRYLKTIIGRSFQLGQLIADDE